MPSARAAGRICIRHCRPVQSSRCSLSSIDCSSRARPGLGGYLTLVRLPRRGMDQRPFPSAVSHPRFTTGSMNQRIPFPKLARAGSTECVMIVVSKIMQELAKLLHEDRAWTSSNLGIWPNVISPLVRGAMTFPCVVLKA